MKLSLRKKAQNEEHSFYHMEIGFDDRTYRARDIVGGVLVNICEGLGGESSTGYTPAEVRRAAPITDEHEFRYVQFRWVRLDSRDVAAKECYKYLEEGKRVANYMLTWREDTRFVSPDTEELHNEVFDVELYSPSVYEPLVEEE